MPGNEVGDKIHNFFGQQKLAQDQSHPQFIDGSWPGPSNNLWAGNQRQIGTSNTSNLKNHNIHQSADSERGHGSHPSGLEQLVNFSQATLRPGFATSQSQSQQTTLNGCMPGYQAFATRQNEANFVGVDTEADQHNSTSRGFSIPESQLGIVPENQKRNSARMDFTESPVNFDFFGGQHQMGSQHPGMLQSLPRQQSGINEMQLLQQEVILKQMQEIQRQQQLQKQQLQQQQARQLHSSNQVSSFAQHPPNSQSQGLINGIRIHDASNYSWPPELMMASPNWPQRGMSPVMQGTSSGLMFSSEQGQAPCLMGIAPQQMDQSLYDIPNSGTRITPAHHSATQIEKPRIQQIPGSTISSPGNQYSGFPDQVSMQDGTSFSRQEHPEKILIGSADGQGFNNGFNLENLPQVDSHQNNRLLQEFHGRQEMASPSKMLREKTMMPVASSHNVAMLDPTEEKILFGSEDNLWEAFGKGNMGSGGCNKSDGTDYFRFPSVQSGSWSALMQSAVAETSSGDVGLQEEWSGLTFRDNQPPAVTQQSPNISDSGKQQHFSWADSGLHTSFTLNSRPLSMSHTSNISELGLMSGVQQSGVKTSDEQSVRKQTGSSQRFTQQLPAGAKCLDHSLLQKGDDEGSLIHKKPDHSSELESSEKSISGSWTNQQSLPIGKTGGQPWNISNGWNLNHSTLLNSSAAFKDQRDKNSLQASQDTGHKSPMLATMCWGGNPEVNCEDSARNQVAGKPNSSFVRANPGSSQHVPSNGNLDIWKQAGSSVNHKLNEIPRKLPHMDKSQPNFNSFRSNSLNNGRVEAHEVQNLNINENVSNSFHQVSLQGSSGAREGSGLHASESCALPGAKQKSSGHISRKASAIRKFQYHPMGDVEVDVEPSEGGKHVMHSQSLQQQISQGLKGHDQGYFGQSKFPSHMARSSLVIEKGHSSGFQGENAPNNSTTSSQNMLELLHKVDQAREPGNAIHNSSSNHDQSSEMAEAENSGGSSLQQHQHFTSQGFALQLAPPSQCLTTSDVVFSSGSALQAKNYPTSNNSTSTTWLPSASSVQPLSHSCETSQGELRTNISGTIGQDGKDFQENFPSALPPFFHNSRHHENQQIGVTGGRPPISQSVNLPFDRFSSQLQEMNKPFERAPSSQSVFASLSGTSGTTSHNDIASSAELCRLVSRSQNLSSDSAQQFPLLEVARAPQSHDMTVRSQEGDPPNISPSIWTSVSMQQHSFGSQTFRAPSNMLKSTHLSNHNAEATLSQPQKLREQNAQRGGNGAFECGIGSNSHCLVEKEYSPKGDHEQQVSPENDLSQKTMSALQGKEPAIDHLAGLSSSSPTTTQREIEAFGRSLVPNNNVHQSYSLLHPVKGMKNTEVDPGTRTLKRFKGPDGAVDARLVASQGGQQSSEHNNLVRDSSTVHPSMPRDSKILRFPRKPTNDLDKSPPSQDLFTFSWNDSQNFTNSNSAASVRVEHSQISPQMAPSWFDRYGTFKNGHILPVSDAGKTATMKTMEMPLADGKPTDRLLMHNSMDQGNVAADVGQCGIQKVPLPASLPSENLASPQLLLSDAADVGLVAVGPKKCKTATPELLPWNKEVVQHPQRLQNISMAEVDWARASNCLTEKVKDEITILEDGPPVLRSKRRLILTTQLMQLLFHPPLTSLLSADAVSHYESVAYSAARSTLGDACTAYSSTGHDTLVPFNCKNLLPEKVKTSERISDEYLSKVMEDLVNRAKKIETDLFRLDKRTSISELRVECQELEKISVINRFAKFHGRAQTDVSETLSSSDAPAIAQKPYPQRYVTALPMPRNLPERVQCLSL
uniref:Uncharacterized protein n=2 Tax=Rhizophora mucronata TaxID=61149 RepID=A0A2P2LL70_RHIMU